MKLTAEIHVTTEKIDALQRCFAAEIPAMQTKRSGVDVQTKGNTITFAVESKDPTALRATLHTITKLLSVFEKGSSE